ncbi:glycosyltransferase family 2 protein [Streptococcus lutetiensis]|uniref:glycosyltransferase family 2 protein n=1 Tax=Streptococcus lutetiensis TaxID=150055 RepID=UPI001965A0B1|nr:glycosyltransferase family 2 protein [Streptococcus lutetiensis]
MKDLVSVIVPVYNVEKYIHRCITSIINQSYSELEIILVDDGSSDSSGLICDEYALKDKRIKVIHKKNGGLGYARNSGLDCATGKYVTFIDSDDYVEQDMIEKLYKDLIGVEADTCIGGFQRVYHNGTFVYENPLSGRVFEKEEILIKVLSKMFGQLVNSSSLEMSVWKVLFSNELIQKYNIRFPSEREFISEDIIFDTEYYAKANRVVMSSDVGYYYCDNEDSLTTKYNPNRFDLQVKLYLELIERVKRLKIYEVSIDRLNATLIAVARYSIKLEQKFSFRNGLIQSKRNIKEICQNSVLKNALISFKSKNVNFQSRVVNWLIKNNCINFLFGIMFIKNNLLKK